MADMSSKSTASEVKKRFDAFVREERLFRLDDTLLLAVSGGLDSVVLLDLVQQGGFTFQMAHVNFGLRGAESDRDEAHVRSLALAQGVPLHLKKVDTLAFASNHKSSIQEAARDIRYAWFQELVAAMPIGRGGRRPKILTAHHMDDNIETMFFHLFRGTGIAGLRGMLPSGPVAVHPLLFAHRSELEAYAHDRGLHYVEDSSNQTVDYDRNFIRLRILPLLEQRFPQVRQTMARNWERFRDEEVLHQMSVATWKNRLLQEAASGGLRIAVEKLRQATAGRTLLWEILRDFGFSPMQSEEAFRLLDAATGRFVSSSTHRVLRDRSWLLIHRQTMPDTSVIIAEAEDTKLVTPAGTLSIQARQIFTSEIRDEGLLKVTLDAKEVRYPLLIRKWRPGDYMYPLGMRKKKKVARILIDQRIPRDQKERTWVVESDRRIVWLIGIRIDDRFRCTPATAETISLQWAPAASEG